MPNIQPLDTALLLNVSSRITTGWELCDSKWQQGEAELIACQTINACANNFRDHGEAISWCGSSALGSCGTGLVDNGSGVSKLQRDGSIVLEPYTGKLTPSKPDGIAKDKDGKFFVFRVTNSLLKYADGFIQ